MVDTVIRLFESTETSFLSNGFGSLPDASKCEVVEERNGSFELEMEYHISGKHYSELELRRIIVAKPNPYATPQPFRIYSISKPMNGFVTVKAEHISYDMAGYPVSRFTASNAAEALTGLKENAIVDCPFAFSTDVDKEIDFLLTKPASMRSLLGDSSGSVLDVYGGEYEFDVYQITLHAKRGSNHGVTIRYGKNMTDLKQEENCSNVYTAVYPYFLFENNETEQPILIELPEKIVATPGTYNFTRIFPLDVSGDWKNLYEWEDRYPSEEEIREIAENYISDNQLGTPKVSLTVSFEQLSQAKEYETLSSLETVRLCDTVNVEFPKLKVSATSKCIKTTYNVLTGKYILIELGEARSNLASGIASQNNQMREELENRPTMQILEKSVEDTIQSADITAKNLKVNATNVTGQLTADQINSDNLEVNAANVTGVLQPNQVNMAGLQVNAANVTGQLTANQIDSDGLEVYATNVKGALRPDQIDSDNLEVKAANIVGKLTSDQIEESVFDAINERIEAQQLEIDELKKQINPETE